MENFLKNDVTSPNGTVLDTYSKVASVVAYTKDQVREAGDLDFSSDSALCDLDDSFFFWIPP